MTDHSFETPGEIFLRLATKHGYPNILELAAEFIEREKTIAEAEACVESDQIAALDAKLAASIEQAEDRIAAYDERMAIRKAADDGLTTQQRAIASLQRPERFPGEHACAREHLKDSQSSLSIFTEGDSE